MNIYVMIETMRSMSHFLNSIQIKFILVFLTHFELI